MPADPDGQSAGHDLQSVAVQVRRDFGSGTRGRRPAGVRPSEVSQGRGLFRVRRVPAKGRPGLRCKGGGPDGHPRLMAESEAGRLFLGAGSFRGRRRALWGVEVHRVGRHPAARVPALPVLRQDRERLEEVRASRSGNHADQQGHFVQGPFHGWRRGKGLLPL